MHGSGPATKEAAEQWACLLSVLAGMHAGRAYLCTAAPVVVQQLCLWMQDDADAHQSNVSPLLGLP